MELIYSNNNGESIYLNQRRPYFLQDVKGSSNLSNAVQTFKAPDQDGAFYLSSSLDMRNITLEGTIVANSPEEAAVLRKNLVKAFNPKSKGSLQYRNARIPCIVEDVTFNTTNIARAPKFFIGLLCPTTFFESIDELRAELVTWESGFQFILEIPEDTGVEFASRTASQLVTLDNPGDVPCGCIVSFLAQGVVMNPEIKHLDTNETIKFNRTMTAGEELRVFTHFAGKHAVQIIRGAENNAMPFLDTGSSFIQLLPGSNTLWCNAAGHYDLLDIEIFYKPLYLGV